MSTRLAPPPKRPAAAAPSPTADMHVEQVATPEGPKAALVVDGTAPLPPAGDERREVLKQREDDLAARLARIESEMGIDSSGSQKPMTVDRDIARVYDQTKVDNAVEGFVYYWANEQTAGGIDVRIHEIDGYEVVCGDMPEAPKTRDVRGYRRVGDTILMRCTFERAKLNWERDMRKRQHRRDSTTSRLEEMGERARGLINVTDLNPYMLQRLARQAAAKQMATSITTSRLKAGTHPGLTRNT